MLRYFEIIRHDSILLRKGKRNFTRAKRAYGRAWWRISLSYIALAFSAFTSLSLTSLGDAVFQFSGVATGGVMSCVALSVVSTDLEIQFLENMQVHQELGYTTEIRKPIQWKRYVDDIIAVSSLYCADCLVNFLRLRDPLPLSVSSSSVPGVASKIVWVELEITVVHGQLVRP